MATLSNITVTKELRLCKIDEELGYFHCWEQYGDIIFPGIMVGSNPGGQYSRIFGIVEFDDRYITENICKNCLTKFDVNLIL